MVRPLSVVIPAHDEEAVIVRCLDRLLAGAEPGELDIVVVANGCGDRTADLARNYGPPVRCIELAEGSKPAALNAGDAAAARFPRVYVDADVELGIADLRHLAAALDEPGVLAVSPRLHLDTSGSSWIVRSYHRIWQELPSIRDGLAGRGAFAMSGAGRARFGAFPDLVADDGFVNEVFGPDEKRSVDGTASVVRAPRRLADLIGRKTRSFAGLDQLGGHLDGLRAQSNTAWLRVVRDQPARLLDVPAYLAVTLWSKLAARHRARAGRVGEWTRDTSTRS